MDAGHKSNRLFPGYTTAELELAVLKHEEGRVTNPKIALIKGEIAARKSGASKAFVVPQVGA